MLPIKKKIVQKEEDIIVPEKFLQHQKLLKLKELMHKNMKKQFKNYQKKLKCQNQEQLKLDWIK